MLLHKNSAYISELSLIIYHSICKLSLYLNSEFRFRFPSFRCLRNKMRSVFRLIWNSSNPGIVLIFQNCSQSLAFNIAKKDSCTGNFGIQIFYVGGKITQNFCCFKFSFEKLPFSDKSILSLAIAISESGGFTVSKRFVVLTVFFHSSQNKTFFWIFQEARHGCFFVLYRRCCFCLFFY